jgi:Small, acid-soluble spore proteins, alpha/beta type.
MGTGQRSNSYIVKEASKALNNMKYEMAKDLSAANIIDTSPIQGDYWGYMTARDCGHVGGQMVKNMIDAAERSLAEQALANVQTGFQAGLSSKNDTVQNISNFNLSGLNQKY